MLGNKSTKIYILILVALVSFSVFYYTYSVENFGLDNTKKDEIKYTSFKDISLKEHIESGHIEVSLNPEKDKKIKLAAVGDIMAHMPQVRSANQLSSNEEEYDFYPHFESISHHIDSADLAFCNLETTLGGKDKGYSGFPLFNAPSSLAKAINQTGFDIVSTANNHSMDTGKDGLLRTLEKLEEQNLTPLGTHESKESRDKPPIIEKNDLKLGFAGYTYGTNGIPTPKGQDYLVNRIDKDLMERDIENLKERNADIIIISLHWGLEYERQPSKEQQELGQKLIKMGADIVLGHHPHVLQPAEIKKVTDQDGNKKSGLVVYSLGNFISNQRQRYRDSGVILMIELVYSTNENSLAIKSLDPIPTWVDKYYQNEVLKYRIIDVKKKLDYNKFRTIEKKERLNQIIPETLEKIPAKSEKNRLR